MFFRIIKLSILFILLLAGCNTASASFTISRPSTNNLGLVGHWTFDGKNVVNGVALDSSGNGNNINLFNIATSTFYSTGKIGQGFNFDGVNDAASTTSTSLSLTSAVSVSAWIYSVGTASNLRILVSGPRSNSPWYEYVFVRRNTNQLALGLSTTAGQSETESVGTIPVNTWTHVAGTWDGSNIRLYINGVMDSGSPIAKTGTIVEQNNFFRIGNYNNNLYWNGGMDDVRVYNRALSAGEIKNLYNQGVSKLNKTPTNTLTSGLVGHWTFDGKNVVNGVALDVSGNANNGNLKSIATSTFYSTGKIGQGFNFDGTDDFVTVPQNAALNNLESLTVATWIYPKTQAVDFPSILNKRQAANPGGFLFSYLKTSGSYSNTFFFASNRWDTPGNWVSTPNNSLPLNVWSHIAVTYNYSSTSNDPVIYINGVIQTIIETQAPSGTKNSETDELTIGSDTAKTAEFNGIIDDVRVYNRVLSAGEVKNLYNQGVSKFNKTPTNILTSGLVGHWTFDGKNVVNGVALDSSGNANNGNLVGIATSTFYTAGKIGQGFNFDGTDDYVDLGNPASLQITGAITVVAWIYLDDLSAVAHRIVSKFGATGNRGWELLLDDDPRNNLMFRIAPTASTWLDVKESTEFAEVGQWVHLVGTYEPSVATKIYKNGVLINTNTTSIPASMYNSSSNVNIGRSPSPANPFDGKIDDARVYNRVLSAGEVKTLYNMGR